MLKNEAVKLCQENNFNTGFFEGSDNNSVIDAYELKVLSSFGSEVLQLKTFWRYLNIFVISMVLITGQA